MLPNPLTPPNDSSAALPLHHDAIIFSLGPSSSSPQHASPATPTSNISMSGDEADISSAEDHQDRSGLEDADQDMSDGGVPLVLPASQVSELNPEVEMLDAEEIESDDFGQIYGNPTYQLPEIGIGYVLSSDESDGSEAHEHDTSAIFDVAMETSSEPPSMTVAPHQVSILQIELQHVDGEITADDEHAAFTQQNSTPPIPLPPSLPATLHLLATSPAPAAFLALADILPPTHVGPGVVQFTFPDSPNSLSLPHPSGPHLPGWHTAFSSAAVNNSVALLSEDDAIPSNADADEVEDQYNLSLGEFLYNWAVSPSEGEDSKRRPRRPHLSAIHNQRYPDKLDSVKRCDLHWDKCDIQGLNWHELGVSRISAKSMRQKTYKNYTSLQPVIQCHPLLRKNGVRLHDREDFLSFRRMDFDHKIHLAHFQLRNLLACPSLDRVFYAGRSQVLKWDARNGHGLPRSAMDLTHPELQSFHGFIGGVQISTLTAAHDVLVAGGFCGEYGLVNLRSSASGPHTEGLLSDLPNNITNHIQVQLGRRSGTPEAVFASNDCAVRILDCHSNKFVAEHSYEHAINCTAVSPDRRLRVLVGDSREVMICNAETGEPLQNLEGHRDYGFACDWADDGWTVATGNQDMQIKIWDARKWTDRQGVGNPFTTLSAEVAGVRKLKFSPLGSGKRVLVAAEPADIVSIIDADTFQSKQTLEFFGEIGGVDFTKDGNDLVVANCDTMRGGIMQFERCGWASEGLYGLKISDRARWGRGGNGYDWRRTVEEVVADAKTTGTKTAKERRPAHVGANMGAF